VSALRAGLHLDSEPALNQASQASSASMLDDDAGPILVTGSAGFIGSHLVARLRDTGADVHEIRNHADCDLRDLRAVQDRIRCISPRAIIHLAASPDSAYHSREFWAAVSDTVASTYNVLTAISHDRDILFVHAGSYKQYGDVDIPFTENVPVRPQSPYARAKQMSEELVRLHARDRPDMVCLRLGPVFGPKQDPAGLIPTIVNSFLGSQSDLVLTNAPWDPLYVTDAVEAICLSLVKPAARSEIVNVSGGTPCSPWEIFQLVAAELDMDPSGRVVLADASRAAPCLGDIGRARRLLDWQPRMPLISGLRLTINYLFEQHRVQQLTGPAPGRPANARPTRAGEHAATRDIALGGTPHGE
jgi:UDP-glucose 4-epimerase